MWGDSLMRYFFLRFWFLAVLFFMNLLLFLQNSSFAQVNTEALRKSEIRQGFSMASGLNLEMAKGNSDYFKYNTQLRFDYKRPQYHSFLVFDLKKAEQEKKLFVNKGFMHGRIVRAFSDKIAAEIFGQLEFDDFIKLKERKLGGLGARIQVKQIPKKIGLFVGAGIMRELENYSNPMVGSKSLFRSTNYLTGWYNHNSIISMSFTGYYQPDIKNNSDYRVLCQAGLAVKLFANFSLTTSLEYRFDNEPLYDIKKYDLGISNGIALSF